MERRGRKKNKKGKRSADDFDNVSSTDEKSPGADSGEELYRFFEEREEYTSLVKPKKRKVSGKKETRSSLKETHSTSWDSDEDDKLVLSQNKNKSQLIGSMKSRLGGKIDQREGTRSSKEHFNEFVKESKGEESLDILEKMKRKNQKTLRRMKEIEQDKLMFA